MNKKIRAAVLAAIGVSLTAAVLYYVPFTNPKQTEKLPANATAMTGIYAEDLSLTGDTLHYEVSDGRATSQKRFQLSQPANDMKLKVENRSNTAFTVSLTHLSGESVSNSYFAAHVEPGVPWEWSPDQSGQKDGLPKGDYILQIRASGNPVHAEVWGSLSLAKS